MNLLYSASAKAYFMTLGDSGPFVERVQERLKELNYLKVVDGEFGSKTLEAVKAFQKRNGLTVDGVVGKKTREKIFSENAKKASTPTATPKPPSNNNPASSKIDVAKATKFVNYAMKFLGCDYVRGGKGPKVFDCSGFVYYCLNNAGIGIKQAYMTSHGWAKTSLYPKVTKFSPDALLIGDILCFDGHVGIYMGDGRMIDAASGPGEVRICTNLFTSSYWSRNFICARRVF